MLFQFDSRFNDQYKVVNLHGKFIEVDGANALICEIEQDVKTSCKNFMINLKDLQYINSIGLNGLIKVVRIVNQQKGSLVFTNASEKMTDLLRILKLNSVLTICENEAEAMAQMKN